MANSGTNAHNAHVTIPHALCLNKSREGIKPPMEKKRYVMTSRVCQFRSESAPVMYALKMRHAISHSVSGALMPGHAVSDARANTSHGTYIKTRKRFTAIHAPTAASGRAPRRHTKINHTTNATFSIKTNVNA